MVAGTGGQRGQDRVPTAPNPPSVAVEVLTFEERYDETVHWVDKRRHKWDLWMLEWADARQRLIIRVWKQYPLYDPAKGPYSHWVNKVISNEWKNILRDHYTSFSRPCILGCPFNAGGEQCTKTLSGLQCVECPLFRDWQKRKGDHFAVKQTLPLENHSNEAQNRPSDFIDIAGKKRVIDARMKERLTASEWKIYRLLIIKGLPEEEVARQMGFKKKRGKKTKMFAGYSVLLQSRHKFVAVAKSIIEDENLAA